MCIQQRHVSGLWLEMAIVADHTMAAFHGDKAQHYILALMNIVSKYIIKFCLLLNH